MTMSLRSQVSKPIILTDAVFLAELFDKCAEELRQVSTEPTHVGAQIRLQLACLKHCDQDAVETQLLEAKGVEKLIATWAVGREELEGLLDRFEELKKGAAREHMSGTKIVIMLFGSMNAYWSAWDFFSHETPMSICRLDEEEIERVSRLSIQAVEAALDQPMCIGYAGATVAINFGVFMRNTKVTVEERSAVLSDENLDKMVALYVRYPQPHDYA